MTGYDVSSSNTLYTADDFSFSGDATISGTDTGSYPMNLAATDFTNTNSNFTDVTFVIVDGSLERRQPGNRQTERDADERG